MSKSEQTETLWQGKNWRLAKRQIQLPTGKIVGKSYIDHPGAVVLVPLVDDEVLMIRQYRAAIDGELLELPAGTRHPDEDWLSCAQRELREETGYRAAEFIDLGIILPGPGMTNERMALYLATGLSPDSLPTDEDEQISVATMKLDTALQMALDGRLEDAKSIVALLRATHYLQTK